MTQLTTFLVSKGVQEFSRQALAALKVDTFDVLVKKYLYRIDQKLDVLLNAPYRSATMLLREGDIDNARKKLIDAIAHDALHVAARILYIYVLCFQKKYALAAKLYFEFLDDFGYREDLVPSVIYDAYCESINRFCFDSPEEDLKNSPPHSVRLYAPSDQHNDASMMGYGIPPTPVTDAVYPFIDKLWFSTNAMVVRWKGNKRIFFGFLNYDLYRIEIYKWRGVQSLYYGPCASVTGQNADITAVTTNYALIDNGDELELYDLRSTLDMGDLKPIHNYHDREKIMRAFYPPEIQLNSLKLAKITFYAHEDVKNKEWKNSKPIFGNVRITITNERIDYQFEKYGKKYGKPDNIFITIDSEIRNRK